MKYVKTRFKYIHCVDLVRIREYPLIYNYMKKYVKNVQQFEDFDRMGFLIFLWKVTFI